MKKPINFKILYTALALMLVFGVIASVPMEAKAYYYDNFDTGSRYSYDSSYYQPVVRPIYVTQPVYITQPVIIQQPIIQYNPLVSSCSVSVNYNNNSGIASVVWTANPSGGNGYYSYSWTGTDGFYSSNKNAYYNYSTSGLKYASVNITSGGHTITVNCSPLEIRFPQPVYYQPVVQPVYIQPNYSNNLDVACYADPTNAKIDQPVNWNVEVVGGIAPYTYSWTGSEGLNGTQKSIIKYYGTPGSKNAIVTVSSADGRSSTKACSNTVTIASPYKAPAKKVVKAPTAPVVSKVTVEEVVVPAKSAINPVPTASNMSATSILSLQNVPWGWVAVMIILVLFFTVMYLLFNKKKI